MALNPYTISDDGLSITCTSCGKTSFNPHDVAQRYCSRCHVFHDEHRGVGDILAALNAAANSNGVPAMMTDDEVRAVRHNEAHADTVAPISTDFRIEETARLTGDSIRAAVEHVSAHIMALVVDAEQQVAKLRLDAEDFVVSLKSIGNAHAKRIESALNDLRLTCENISRERDRIMVMNKAADRDRDREQHAYREQHA